jgi:hypothetical protein
VSTTPWRIDAASCRADPARSPGHLPAGAKGHHGSVSVRFVFRIAGVVVLGVMLGISAAGMVGLVLGPLVIAGLRAVVGPGQSIDAFINAFGVLVATLSMGSMTGGTAYVTFRDSLDLNPTMAGQITGGITALAACLWAVAVSADRLRVVTQLAAWPVWFAVITGVSTALVHRLAGRRVA